MLKRARAKGCLSVCLSVTVQDIEINFTPYDIAMFLVFGADFAVLSLWLYS